MQKLISYSFWGSFFCRGYYGLSFEAMIEESTHNDKGCEERVFYVLFCKMRDEE